MSKMESSTKILRRILDERGVEWDGCILMGAPITFWGEQERDGRWPYRYWEHDGWASFSADPKSELFTPEQAVAATLGREPDDAAMAKLHDQMNAAMLKYEMAQGIEKRDEDGAIVVPWVLKMHVLLEEAATLGSCNCSNNCTNSERTDATRLPHFWTHDGTLHIEATRMPTRIVVCEGGTCEFVPKRELDASEAENAKLRELVCIMLRVAGVAEYATDSEWQVVTDYLRELGIEVD